MRTPRIASRDLTAFGYRRIVVLLVALVVVPTALMLAVGVVLLVLGELSDIVMGILVLALSGAATTGVILVWVFVRREANLSKLQSDFVSKVSHELRTPLTSIRLFTETLQLRRGDAATEERCLAGLDRESQRLQELIDRLLDWGRMESGRRLYLFEPTDVREVVSSAVQAVESLDARPGGNLSLSLSEVPLVSADPGALTDVLVNLLTNALKYGGSPAEIEVQVRSKADKVRISVRDNGAGIQPTEHKRIFQKFYRVDDRLSREREGSGLGLAIVKHVVEAHQGRIELTSVPGEGSTFTVVLDADPEVAGLAAAPSPAKHSAEVG
ncbi:MAG: two-component sensor histidine kinase [Polyangiaceae bacterium]|nr:two-component sensor histidine kinase [Polyangiaceae bacterium]MCW5792653.1 two-component sensor histidine kinase [Polyangiaceae bacterium]